MANKKITVTFSSLKSSKKINDVLNRELMSNDKFIDIVNDRDEIDWTIKPK